jgi:hypothetical protein
MQEQLPSAYLFGLIPTSYLEKGTHSVPYLWLLRCFLGLQVRYFGMSGLSLENKGVNSSRPKIGNTLSVMIAVISIP